MKPHPLAWAYLRAAAEAHHARGHTVPTGMPSPAMQMHRARDAWQRAGCPLEEAPGPYTAAAEDPVMDQLLAALPDQPPPQPGTGDVWADLIAEAGRAGRFSPELLAAMRERRELGIARYGTPLQYGNGRDARVDAVQEFLDGAVYCRQGGDRAGAIAALRLAEQRIRPRIPYRLDTEPGPLGDLDLAAEGTIRIERMGDASMWIRVEHADGAVVINLHSRGGRLRQVVEVERE